MCVHTCPAGAVCGQDTERLRTQLPPLKSQEKEQGAMHAPCTQHHRSESQVAQPCPTLRPRGLQPTRLLGPWDSPGKSTGVGCHLLLQGIFQTQGSNPSLPHCRQTLYPLSQQGCPAPLKKWADKLSHPLGLTLGPHPPPQTRNSSPPSLGMSRITCYLFLLPPATAGTQVKTFPDFLPVISFQ